MPANSRWKLIQVLKGLNVNHFIPSPRKKMPDFSDAVMPATAPVTFRNRDPDGTDTHCLFIWNYSDLQ
jgi:hypothetical protein